MRAIASGGQYVLPLICVAGAGLSAWRRRERGTLMQNVVQSDSADALNGMSWQQFEQLVGEAFRLQGYTVAEAGGGAEDGVRPETEISAKFRRDLHIRKLAPGLQEPAGIEPTIDDGWRFCSDAKLGAGLQTQTGHKMATHKISRTSLQASPRTVVSLFLDKSPDAVLDTVLACARDGDPRWKFVFGIDLVRLIASTAERQQRFFDGLLDDRPAQHGAPILNAYLGALTPAQRSALLSPAAAKAKAHPARKALRGAATKTTGFKVYCSALEVFIRHGRTHGLLDDIVHRERVYFGKACLQGNRGFLDLVVPNLPAISDKLLIEVVEWENSERAVFLLHKEFGVPISQFVKPNVLGHAIEKTSEFIISMDARVNPIPDSRSSGRR